MDAGPPIEELHLAEEPDVDVVPGARSQEFIERQQQLDSSAIAYPDRHVLRLLPPLVLTDRQATVGCDILADAIRAETREQGRS